MKHDVNNRKVLDQESQWDQRAKEFNSNQIRRKQKLPQNVVDFILEQFPDIESVIDVGGGSGRYAVLFVQKKKSLLMTDISNNMIEYARENVMKQEGANARFMKINWEDEKEREQIKNERFDLVFTSMCPATRSVEGADSLMHYSANYCAMHQFIQSKDSFLEFVKERQKIQEGEKEQEKKKFDPHNDREIVIEVFQHLWNLGYTPNLHSFEEETVEEMSVEEAVTYYKKRVHVGQLTEDDIKALVIEYATDNKVQVKKIDKSMLIVWKVKK
jgi:SAM-dependent methyltransferase